MPDFLLSFRLGSEEAVRITIKTDDEQGARREASAIIAQGLDRPGTLVLLAAGGRFHVGAGFWSRSGIYGLEAQPLTPQDCR